MGSLMDVIYKPICDDVHPVSEFPSCDDATEDESMINLTEKPIQSLPLQSEPVLVVDETIPGSQPISLDGTAPNEAVAGLRRAFLRRNRQAANFRDRQFKELEAASEDDAVL
jgi:hypothetical protein